LQKQDLYGGSPVNKGEETEKKPRMKGGAQYRTGRWTACNKLTAG
jgi:hypothetical protein